MSATQGPQDVNGWQLYTHCGFNASEPPFEEPTFIFFDLLSLKNKQTKDLDSKASRGHLLKISVID